MELESLTPENLGKAVSITLRPEQEAFVAPVVQSIAEAYVNPTAWLRLVVDGDEVLAFIMGNFDPDHEIEAFRAGIWRLNVAASAQGRGVGRFAVRALEEEARARGVKRISVLWERGEHGPEGFYLKLGFVPTGEELFGEVVSYKDLHNQGKVSA
ncbi:GNAT family N-acetyltransferase [Arthrobacter sedimenti]|uniref:GNAT family N-acetyltransferase n=1 Tax=Arthrobacter sedimenti TaxID=2694931 RepID=UPI000B34AA18|nr:GNAT family N-acetyltransferase [Arthrobacter sedimenti]OUM45664.1 GNAT family N-acetyltransferase [Arthrobacter agilis]